MSVLRLPQPQAEQELTRRIEIGLELMQHVKDELVIAPRGPRLPISREELAETRRQAMRWHAFNQTWVDKNLGGEASDEYRKHQSYGYRNVELDQLVSYETLRQHLPREVSLLESIRDRLPLWIRDLETSAPAGHAAHVTPDAPIFIVHGSDARWAGSVAYTVTSVTGRKAIIIRDKPNLGRTLIEKLESHASQVSYVIIVLTPDDRGGRENETRTRPRGRQDVIFEMGYFYGLIGRDRVSVLLVPGVEKPSDMDGIAYITLDDSGAWKTELLRELQYAGFDISL